MYVEYRDGIDTAEGVRNQCLGARVSEPCAANSLILIGQTLILIIERFHSNLLVMVTIFRAKAADVKGSTAKFTTWCPFCSNDA